MSPSPSSQLLARLPVLLRAAKTGWPRRILLAVGALFGVLVLYLLGLGPILRLYGVRPSSGWDRLPAVVRIIYKPIDHLPIPERLARILRGYNGWWMRASTEQADFAKQMTQLNSSITIGMLQTDVISALGEPVWWQTNKDRVAAEYIFMPPLLPPFDILTNGVRIDFSNGVVVGKSPTTILSNGKTRD
jgi:hypothetical protein